MIYSSLAVIVMSASAAVSPLSNLIHLHPRAASTDTRVSVTLLNQTGRFRDIEVDGHIYTVMPNTSLNIKAPAGTVIYAASRTMTHKRGEAILEVNGKLDHARVFID